MNEYQSLAHDMAQQIITQNALLDRLEMPIPNTGNLPLANFPGLLFDIEQEIEAIEAQANEGTSDNPDPKADSVDML